MCRSEKFSPFVSLVYIFDLLFHRMPDTKAAEHKLGYPIWFLMKLLSKSQAIVLWTENEWIFKVFTCKTIIATLDLKTVHQCIMAYNSHSYTELILCVNIPMNMYSIQENVIRITI